MIQFRDFDIYDVAPPARAVRRGPYFAIAFMAAGAWQYVVYRIASGADSKVRGHEAVAGRRSESFTAVAACDAAAADVERLMAADGLSAESFPPPEAE